MPKVAVAMSGGVDSSVAAAMLRQQGYDVIGMMLRLWSQPGMEDSNRCCTPDAMAQARRVAASLDIPFYVIDAKNVFREEVVSYFLEGYARGETPNPCLACNRHVRWDFLLEHALAMGAEYMATGHYARRQTTDGGRHTLLRAIDLTKDQSYVLHVLSQKQLARALFPVGEYPKLEIREMAKTLNLSVASRPDSQDLCFLAGEDYRTFLQEYLPQAPLTGEILTRDGRTLGRHSGLPFYTIGQRKGLGVASPQPLYVLEKDVASNTLIVGAAQEMGSRELVAEPVNWTAGIVPQGPFHASVKIRYSTQAVEGLVTPLENGRRACVRFDTPLRDITPGQAAVFYQGDMVVGGGLIVQPTET